ncbi:hypothetical protein G3M48_004187 [Beauveria asiatica]|uniref:Acyltransferase 3 domain-containing protein n=1 Tax=Beauveria asiatica TaxID=1069075 RepID=A0AAW0RU05_9HYPO
MASQDSLRSAPSCTLASQIFFFLMPSFLRKDRAREAFSTPPPPMAPTAYLDGMRGLAALSVFSSHLCWQTFDTNKSWGTAEDNYHIMKLPLLRLLYGGPPAVCVFFVISGYALSYRPLGLVHRGATSELSTTMSSLTFRRGIRLYLPTAISTFMVVCLLRVGAYELTRPFANDPRYLKYILEPHPERLKSSCAQIQDWMLTMFRLADIFTWDGFAGWTTYDVHLWTIPVEFRCSLCLFLVIIATARLQSCIRLLAVGGVSWFAYLHSRWDLCLFFSGMVLAELDFARNAHVCCAGLPKSHRRPIQRRWYRIDLAWVFVSILGLYLMSQPEDGGEAAPGWRFLTSLIPGWWAEESFRYWQSIGACAFVLAAGRSQTWRRFFNSPVMQYFGKVSYALYLMQGPAMHSIGYHLFRMAYILTGVEGYKYNIGFVLGATLCIPTVIWLADVFWRAVDIPAVNFAKWIEMQCLSEGQRTATAVYPVDSSIRRHRVLAMETC